jgi:hypothetical protein
MFDIKYTRIRKLHAITKNHIKLQENYDVRLKQQKKQLEDYIKLQQENEKCLDATKETDKEIMNEDILRQRFLGK